MGVDYRGRMVGRRAEPFQPPPKAIRHGRREKVTTTPWYSSTHFKRFTLPRPPSVLLPPHSPTLLPLQRLIQPGLNLAPQAHDLHVAERHDLARDDPAQPFLAVAPPEQVRQPRPPARRAAAAGGAGRAVQEEAQAPALRLVVGLRVEFG